MYVNKCLDLGVLSRLDLSQLSLVCDRVRNRVRDSVNFRLFNIDKQ